MKQLPTFLTTSPQFQVSTELSISGHYAWTKVNGCSSSVGERDRHMPYRFEHAALTIATMPALIASGNNSGQAATAAARPGSVLQVSVGKWWVTAGAGSRKSFGGGPLGEPACGLIIHHQSLPEAALTIATMPARTGSGSRSQA